MLFSHSDVNILDIPLVFRNQTSRAHVESGLLPHFADSAIDVFLIFVDLSAWEGPRRAFLPALDEHHALHALIEKDGAAHRHAHLVCQELLIRGKMLLAGEATQ